MTCIESVDTGPYDHLMKAVIDDNNIDEALKWVVETAGLFAPEFIEDRDCLVVRFTRPVKTEGRLDDAELALSIIRKNPGTRQVDIVESNGMSLSKVKRIVADLRDSGKMTRVGSNRNGR